MRINRFVENQLQSLFINVLILLKFVGFHFDVYISTTSILIRYYYVEQLFYEWIMLEKGTIIKYIISQWHLLIELIEGKKIQRDSFSAL